MKWRTQLPVPETDLNIRHQDRILAMGSCFATNIGARLKSLKWPIDVNPLGIVYNPVSLSRHLSFLMEPPELEADDLVERDGLVHHWDFHGDMSGLGRERTADNISSIVRQQAQKLGETRWLLITFGTAHVYVLRSSGRIVANCHKFPAGEFDKKLLDRTGMIKECEGITSKLLERFPDLNILVSVSPVRHLADGLIANSRSKAELVGLAHQLVSSHPRIHYFPGYELVLDDLRDYRFYDRDLAHPNDLAMDYIWDYFSQSFMDDTTLSLVREVQKVRKDLDHRPFHPESPTYRKFLEGLLERMEAMMTKHDYIDWANEITGVKERIGSET